MGLSLNLTDINDSLSFFSIVNHNTSSFDSEYILILQISYDARSFPVVTTGKIPSPLLSFPLVYQVRIIIILACMIYQKLCYALCATMQTQFINLFILTMKPLVVSAIARIQLPANSYSIDTKLKEYMEIN